MASGKRGLQPNLRPFRYEQMHPNFAQFLYSLAKIGYYHKNSPVNCFSSFWLVFFKYYFKFILGYSQEVKHGYIDIKNNFKKAKNIKVSIRPWFILLKYPIFLTLFNICIHVGLPFLSIYLWGWHYWLRVSSLSSEYRPRWTSLYNKYKLDNNWLEFHL